MCKSTLTIWNSFFWVLFLIPSQCQVQLEKSRFFLEKYSSWIQKKKWPDKKWKEIIQKRKLSEYFLFWFELEILSSASSSFSFLNAILKLIYYASIHSWIIITQKSFLFRYFFPPLNTFLGNKRKRKSRLCVDTGKRRNLNFDTAKNVRERTVKKCNRKALYTVINHKLH